MKKELNEYQKETRKEELITLIKAASVGIIVWLLMCLAVYMNTKDNKIETYDAYMTVVDKYEEEYQNNNVALNNLMNMPQGTFKTTHKMYVIVVEFEKGQEGKGEFEVTEEEYTEISRGDIIAVEVEEVYKKGEFNSYEITLK